VSERVLASVDEVTPAWLASVLGTPVGTVRVARVHEEQVGSISYFLETDGDPSRLFLKLPRGPAGAAGEREVGLYRAVGADQASLPLVRCLDAAWDAETRRYHLLLEDLSETHDQPAWHLDVAERYVFGTVDCLARLHAYWWLRPHRAEELTSVDRPDDQDARLARLRAAFPEFVDALDDRLSSDDRHVYERLLEELPRLTAERAGWSSQTVVHGDAHFWNFLYARDPSRDDTRVLDWQTYHRGPAVEDVAYLLVLRDPHRTPERERSMLERYHRELGAAGVDLGCELFHQQYRHAALEQLLMPLNACSWGAPADFWPLFVPRALAAFRDLDCRELLSRRLAA
jgi:hypothetical protein